MSLSKIPQTRVIKKLGLSTVVAWDLSNCVSVEEAPATGLDLSARKVLPTHIVGIAANSSVVLPNPALHQGRAITIKATSGNAVQVLGDVDGDSLAAPITDAAGSILVYSDGAEWKAF